MNLFILCLVSTVFVLETASCFTIKQNTTDEKKAIIGGYIVSNPAGYHVSLRCRTTYFCGGSLISAQHVLTAAHCIECIEKNNCLNNVDVLAGSNNRLEGLYIPAATYIKHPKYSSNTGYDIAVIKLQYPFTFSDKIWMAPLVPYPPRLYEPLSVTGYGRVNPETNDVSVILKAYDTSLLTFEECYKRNGDYVTPTDICDFGEPNVGTCQGDSGGPVFNSKYLIGVVSGGVSPTNKQTGVVECNVGYPNIFTSVYYHLDFINYWLSV